MSWFSWIKSLFSPSTDPKQVLAIQILAVRVCGFLPMAETVVNLVAVTNPAVGSIAEGTMLVAKQICKIITEVPPTPAAAVLTLAGEPIPELVGGAAIHEWQVGDVVVTGAFVGKGPKK